VIVDARGLLCPLPVVSLGKAARATPEGSTLRLLADDPVARTDVPAWCRMRGATLQQVVEHGHYQEYVIVTARPEG
jgi:TusA-related sulfurtransferase